MTPSAAERPLDLYEGISDPGASGCLRWPPGLRLMWRDRSGDFGFVWGRCKATNLCPYCRLLAVIETAEMLSLDALEYAPSLLLTLTAREHLTRRDTYRHLEQLRRSVRREWPAEWFVQVEFQKRGALHLHLLVKGVEPAAAARLQERAARLWCSRVDAEPAGQDCRPINASQAIVRYLQKELSHGLKAEQAPPLGWAGHRTSQTRGYFVRPAAKMRREARASLRHKAAVYRAMQFLGPDGEPPSAQDVEWIVEQLLARQAERSWSLVAQHHGDLVAVEGGRAVPLAGRERAALARELASCAEGRL